MKRSNTLTTLCYSLAVSGLLLAGGSQAETQAETQGETIIAGGIGNAGGKKTVMVNRVNLSTAIARVNGVDIHNRQVDRAVKAYLQQRQIDPGQAVQGSPFYKGVRQSVLNELIGQELLWQEAQRTNRVTSEEEVARVLASYTERFPDHEAFVASLEANGFSEPGFTENLRQRLSVETLIEEAIASKVVVGEDEAKAFYAENQARFERPEQFHVRHILIQPDPDAEDEDSAKAEALSSLEAIQAELEGGADFAKLAEEHSQGPSKSSGGDLGFVARGQLVPAFEEAALALAPGEVSDPVETRFGYHLIKLEEHLPAGQLEEEQALDMIKQQLFSSKVSEAVQKRMLELWTVGTVELMGPV
ncbi:peptidylprolyl isomerase [Motiliproteus sp. SC1-56]|uniref:peptidylprolyl isomerase n=1 Tax=Motiliproteus sp. SC1-56 TaxID=2799565 RepID=UPI001A8FD672|nr:peptidylprolyl isomerase [Motiliproteus sp. SC1-56]